MSIRKKGCFDFHKKDNGTIAVVRKFEGEVFTLLDNIKPGKLENALKAIETGFAKQKTYKTLDEYLDILAKRVKLEETALGILTRHKKFLDKKGWKLKRTTKSETNIDIVDDLGNVIFRGSKMDIEKVVKFFKLPKQQRRALIKKAKLNIEKNADIIPYNLSRDNAKIYNIPISESGGSPTFKGLKKYLNADGGFGNKEIITLPSGVSRDVLNKVTAKINKFGGEVKANITGLDRNPDFANSWRAMGVDPVIGEKIRKHYEMTWHHLDNLDENLMSTMQIVIREVHEKTVPHIGSHSQIKELLKLIN